MNNPGESKLLWWFRGLPLARRVLLVGTLLVVLLGVTAWAGYYAVTWLAARQTSRQLERFDRERQQAIERAAQAEQAAQVAARQAAGKEQELAALAEQAAGNEAALQAARTRLQTVKEKYESARNNPGAYVLPADLAGACAKLAELAYPCQ